MSRVISAIIILLLFYSCSNTEQCNEIELKIKEKCVKTDTVYSIPLASLTDFEWDTLYVISGPTVDNEAGDIIGMDDYKKIIPDNSRQYIFIKDNKIVKEYSSYCNLNLSKHPSYTMGHKYSSTSVIQVQKQESEGHFIYKIEEAEK